MNTIKYTGIAIASVMMIDAFAFLAWIMSNQMPVDGFYLGAMTANILKAILL